MVVVPRLANGSPDEASAKSGNRADPDCASLHPVYRTTKTRRGFPRRVLSIDHRDEKISVLGRPGSDLLFQALRLSTIGAEGFNGRVRYGNGFRLLARTTRSAKDENLQAGF